MDRHGRIAKRTGRCDVAADINRVAITEGLGSLVWLGDKRISAVASSSIDRSTVDLNRGEMSFAIFDYDKLVDEIADTLSRSRCRVWRKS
jgi:hypothetical protein